MFFSVNLILPWQHHNVNEDDTQHEKTELKRVCRIITHTEVFSS